MPLSCFPENSRVEITFVQSRSKGKETDVFRRLDQKSGECVKFYIRAIGKEVKRIVKLGQLHKKGCKLCIYAFKEETIKEALCQDGRLRLPLLKNLNWKLVENADTILENTQLVNDLEKRVFEVEFEKKPARADMAEKDEPEQSVTPLLQGSFVDQYPSLRSESQKVRTYLRKTKKISKTEFGKMTRNSTKVAVCKLLSRLSDSVGYLEWNINGRQGSATCFVFKERYIFTSMHVLNMIVGEGIAFHDWINIVSQSTWVIFSYETQTDKEKNKFFIDSSFLLSDATLDYAVMKLKENGQALSGLYPEIDSIPPNGLIYIIGHPDGEAKDTDTCVVIPECQREQECQKRIQNYSPFVHMYTRNSFQSIINNSNVITYDTSFYFGSSGSPIFNSVGALVAIHNAGFAFEYEKKTSSIIEFGSSIKSILHHIYKSEGGTDWFKEIGVATSSYIDWPVEDVQMLSEEENLEGSPMELLSQRE
ncbi:Protein FAM111A [Galemys pyrenaicus]|uniref:Protein FAM111A n=1 Tax=Galemys pyrenaicus TaxID=202257 RepID=A0A8J6DD70_GALPY|nr:Protein FAM111A [Galemys pyrenaicus]